MAAKLRKGDKVIVIAGKDKGVTGEIKTLDPKTGKAIVDGVKMAVDLSNLAVVDANGKATRVGFRMDGDNKVRFAKTTGDAI
jgi:large subunit ribosomal protein L24